MIFLIQFEGLLTPILLKTNKINSSKRFYPDRVVLNVSITYNLKIEPVRNVIVNAVTK